MAVNRETTVRKLVSLPVAMVQAISDFRFRERIGTESEAIRRLIELGLDHSPEAVQSGTRATRGVKSGGKPVQKS